MSEWVSPWCLAYTDNLILSKHNLHGNYTIYVNKIIVNNVWKTKLLMLCGNDIKRMASFLKRWKSRNSSGYISQLHEKFYQIRSTHSTEKSEQKHVIWTIEIKVSHFWLKFHWIRFTRLPGKSQKTTPVSVTDGQTDNRNWDKVCWRYANISLF